MGVGEIIADLFVIFAVAKLVGEVFQRWRQPPVIGELLAGVVIGPYGLGWIGQPGEALVQLFHDPALAQESLQLVYHVVAELGAIFLLFFVGLETRLSELLHVGPRAVGVAVGGVVLPFLLGASLMLLLGHPTLEAAFVGTALVATSVGITARVLSDLGYLHTTEARLILGAAVLDDILGLVALAVVSGVGTTGQVAPLQVATTAGLAIAFTLFAALVGTRAVRRFSIHLERLQLENAPFVVAVLVCLGLAALADMIGLAAIIGAFLAGLAFAEAREQYALEREALPVYQLLVPMFFVITGASVDWRVFLDGSLIGLALTVTALAVLGKVVGCGLGAWGLAPRSIAIVGIGMTPRGEVGLIVASLGQSLGAIPPAVFSLVVVMSVLTTLLVPPLLPLLFRGYPAPATRAAGVGATRDAASAAPAAPRDARLPDL
jgi:Kef-type K+ transport system membrane component KefB